MKLFGGKTEGGHVASVKPQAETQQAAPEQSAEPKPAAAAAVAEWPGTLAAFFRSGGFRRYRIPLMVAGCVVLVALAALIAHAVLVRPPEVRSDGMNTAPPTAPTVKPAVDEQRPIATPPPEELAQTGLPAEETEPPAETELPNYRREDCYTFVLLVRDQVSGGTDTILVCRMDTESGTMDLVNIPRDTLVNVSWGVKKLNTVLTYERNDPERFIGRLSGLIGFTVDNYAIMNLRAVERVVDAMGGVTYTVPRNMDYDDPSQELHIHIAKGTQVLSGADVVKVLRFRVGNDGSGYPDGDLGRIHTQQDLLKTVAAQFLTVGNIPNLSTAINIFEENVTTDLTANNLAFFAEQFLRMKQENIRFHTAPGDAVGIRGGSYYELDLNPWIDLVNEALNPYTAPVTGNILDVVRSLGAEGAVSTNGDVLPLSSFFNFYDYTG